MSVSDFDLAAALGLDRPLEPSAMVAMVAEQRFARDLAERQRDDARRMVCRARYNSDMYEDMPWDGPDDAARAVGWGYLYPEEPEQPDVACSACQDTGEAKQGGWCGACGGIRRDSP